MSSIVTKPVNEIMSYSKELTNTLRNSLYPGAKEESIVMVIDYCRHAKLDIMLKPVHIVPMWIVDKETGKGEMRDVIMPGINLYRIQAARSGCAGISEPEFGEDITEFLGGVEVTYPKWCRVTVKRIIGSQIVEFTAREYWKENYANAGKDKATGKIKLEPNAMWSKRPYGQLAKCTEAQALRKGFPEIGAMPTAEEMEGKHLDSHEYEEMRRVPGKGVHGLKTILGIVDEETGEISDQENESVQPTITSDIIADKIAQATNLDELVLIADLARVLPEDERKQIRILYKDKEKELTK